MLTVTGRFRLLNFVTWFGREHASPNSGYPEAALAGILDCRFGGPHSYFGEIIEKPYIGTNDRPVTTADMERAVSINRRVEVVVVVITCTILFFF
jgi:adenosylcobinamide-phosphate synthase